MYIKQTVAMARNRPPTFHETGDMGARILEIKQYEDDEYQLWAWSYGSAYPISLKTADLAGVQRLFISNLETMTRRLGRVWIYDAADRAAYRRALWAH